MQPRHGGYPHLSFFYDPYHLLPQQRMRIFEAPPGMTEGKTSRRRFVLNRIGFC